MSENVGFHFFHVFGDGHISVVVFAALHGKFDVLFDGAQITVFGNEFVAVIILGGVVIGQIILHGEPSAVCDFPQVSGVGIGKVTALQRRLTDHCRLLRSFEPVIVFKIGRFRGHRRF